MDADGVLEGEFDTEADGDVEGDAEGLLDGDTTPGGTRPPSSPRHCPDVLIVLSSY